MILKKQLHSYIVIQVPLLKIRGNRKMNSTPNHGLFQVFTIRGTVQILH